MVKASLVGNSAEQRQVQEKLSKVVASDTTIVISGLNGTKREVYARYVHRHSPRNLAAFIPVKCSALPADLFENELFGCMPGVFTGARLQSDGLVAAAEGGSLFFDEIDTLDPVCQFKLLRFLQEKEYRRVGETRIRRAKVRIIAATNTDLLAAVRDGRFRADLFNAFTCVHLNRPLWPYGVFGALLFVLATWALFASLIAMASQGARWPDPFANNVVLWTVGIFSLTPLALVLLDFLLRGKATLLSGKSYAMHR